jgi:hypothetical protein
MMPSGASGSTISSEVANQQPKFFYADVANGLLGHIRDPHSRVSPRS